jgi:hypothetical protein
MQRRAAQLRDKINELKGAPTLRRDGGASPDVEGEAQKLWQPKSKGRGGKRRVAK